MCISFTVAIRLSPVPRHVQISYGMCQRNREVPTPTSCYASRIDITDNSPCFLFILLPIKFWLAFQQHVVVVVNRCVCCGSPVDYHKKSRMIFVCPINACASGQQRLYIRSYTFPYDDELIPGITFSDVSLSSQNHTQPWMTTITLHDEIKSSLIVMLCSDFPSVTIVSRRKNIPKCSIDRVTVQQMRQRKFKKLNGWCESSIDRCIIVENNMTWWRIPIYISKNIDVTRDI